MVKYCEFCGAELEDDASFCDECGKSTSSSVNEDVVSSVSKSEQFKSNKLKILVVVIIVIAVVGVVGAFMCGLFEPQQDVECQGYNITVPESWEVDQQPDNDGPSYTSFVNDNKIYEIYVYPSINYFSFDNNFGTFGVNSLKKFLNSQGISAEFKEKTINGYNGFGVVDSSGNLTDCFAFKDSSNNCIYIIMCKGEGSLNVGDLLGRMTIDSDFHFLTPEDVERIGNMIDPFGESHAVYG